MRPGRIEPESDGPRRMRLLFAGLAFFFWGAGSEELHATEELLNFRLSPAYAAWLVGPLGKLATPEEQRTFLALRTDEEARTFIERFWAVRDPDPQRPGNPVRETAEQRIAEADRRFSEAASLGHRTDRGIIFVLYGEPRKIDYEPGQFRGEPPREVWTYGPDAPPGLDGKKPARQYRFVEKDGRVVQFVPGFRRPRPEAGTAAPPPR